MANKVNRLQKKGATAAKAVSDDIKTSKKIKRVVTKKQPKATNAPTDSKSPATSPKSSKTKEKLKKRKSVAIPEEEYSRNSLEEPLNLLQQEKKKKALSKGDAEDPYRQVPVTKKVVAKKGEIIVRPTILNNSPSTDLQLRNPVENMANAFQANAKALELIQQQQFDLTESLERSRAERSKVLVKSNEALNDTFKQLQDIQEQVIDKIEHDKKKSNKTIVLLALASAAMVVFILLAILLSQQKDLQSHKTELSKAVKDIYASLGEAANKEGEVVPTSAKDSPSMQEALNQLKSAYEGRARDAQNEILSLKQQLQQREKDIKQLRFQISQFDKKKDNKEVAQLLEKDEEKQRVIGELAQQIFKLKQELDDFKKSQKANPKIIPSKHNPNDTEVTNVTENSYIKRLNGLLEKNREPAWYRIIKMGKIKRQKISKFEMVELNSRGNPSKKYIADECFISLVPDEGKVIFELIEVRIVLLSQNNRVIRLSSQNVELFKLDWKQWWQYNEEIITLK